MTARRPPGSRGRASGGAPPPGPAGTIAAWSRDQLDIDRILRAARRVLSAHGLVLASQGLTADMQARLTDAGCRLASASDGHLDASHRRIVCNDADLMRLLALVPASFRLAGEHAALGVAPGSGIEIGRHQRHPLLAATISADTIMGASGDRRPLTASAIRDVARIVHDIDDLALSASGLWLECRDLVRRDRLIAFAASDRRPLIADLGRIGSPHAAISAAHAARPRGTSPHEAAGSARLVGIVSIDAMLMVAADTITSIAALAASGNATVIAPTLILGANCPAAVEGALVRFAAEVMGIAAMAQALHPGAIVMAGVKVAEASMRTGLPMVGTAAHLRATAGAIAITRALGLPVAALGPATAAKSIDAHAGCETALWMSVAAAADIVVGAAGALDLDSAASLEKVLLDADMLAALVAASDPGSPPGPDGELPDWAGTITALGPGGVALATPETRDVAMHRRPRHLPDEWLYETWDAAGRPSSVERAARLVADRLAARTGPEPTEPARLAAITAAVDEALAIEPTVGEARSRRPPDRIATIASDHYSSAMRTAFGFKG